MAYQGRSFMDMSSGYQNRAINAAGAQRMARRDPEKTAGGALMSAAGMGAAGASAGSAMAAGAGKGSAGGYIGAGVGALGGLAVYYLS